MKGFLSVGLLFIIFGFASCAHHGHGSKKGGCCKKPEKSECCKKDEKCKDGKCDKKDMKKEKNQEA